MSNLTSVSSVAALPDGLGTLSFVAGTDECFGQLRIDGAFQTIRGSYTAARIVAENDRFTLSLAPIGVPAVNGPRLRGMLLDRGTGESVDVVAFAPKNGKAYGLSREERRVTETHLPF